MVRGCVASTLSVAGPLGIYWFLVVAASVLGNRQEPDSPTEGHGVVKVLTKASVGAPVTVVVSVPSDSADNGRVTGSSTALCQRLARGVYVSLNCFNWACAALVVFLTVWCAIENHPQAIWPSDDGSDPAVT